MTTTAAPDLRPDHTEGEEWPTLGRDPTHATRFGSSAGLAGDLSTAGRDLRSVVSIKQSSTGVLDSYRRGEAL